MRVQPHPTASSIAVSRHPVPRTLCPAGHFDSGVYVRCVGGYWTQIGLVVRDINRVLGYTPLPPPAQPGTAAKRGAAAAPAGAAEAEPAGVAAPAATTAAASGGGGSEGGAGGAPRMQEAVGLFFCDNSADLRWYYLDDKGGVQVRGVGLGRVGMGGGVGEEAEGVWTQAEGASGGGNRRGGLVDTSPN